MNIFVEQMNNDSNIIYKFPYECSISGVGLDTPAKFYRTGNQNSPDSGYPVQPPNISIFLTIAQTAWDVYNTYFTGTTCTYWITQKYVHILG